MKSAEFIQIAEKNMTENVHQNGKLVDIILPKSERQVRPLLEKLEHNGDGVVTQFLDFAMSHQTSRVTEDVTNVTINFTEGLFRNILGLTVSSVRAWYLRVISGHPIVEGWYGSMILSKPIMKGYFRYPFHNTQEFKRGRN